MKKKMFAMSLLSLMICQSAFATFRCAGMRSCMGSCTTTATGAAFSMGGSETLVSQSVNGCEYSNKCSFSCPNGSTPTNAFSAPVKKLDVKRVQ